MMTFSGIFLCFYVVRVLDRFLAPVKDSSQ